MSRPFATPLEVIQGLGRLSATMDSIVAKMRDAEVAAAHARSAASVAVETAFLKAEGPVAVRQAKSKLIAAQEILDSELADVNVRCLRRELQSIENRIDVGRTYSATLRSELTNLPGVS